MSVAPPLLSKYSTLLSNWSQDWCRQNTDKIWFTEYIRNTWDVNWENGDYEAADVYNDYDDEDDCLDVNDNFDDCYRGGWNNRIWGYLVHEGSPTGAKSVKRQEFEAFQVSGTNYGKSQNL